MKLLHTSDWHLGRVLHERPLLDDQAQILGQVIAHCREGGYDALLISGDIFDRSLPSEDAVRLWSRFLRDLRLACPALPLLVIAGNHDSAARIAYASEALALAGIHVRGGVEALELPIDLLSAAGERAQVWMLPFLWAGDLDARGEEDERRIRTQEGTLAEAVGRIRPLQDPVALQVALAHCFARGGSASDSERALVGTATDVDAGLFSAFDYTALGHLHRSQRIGDRVWASGSPMPYSFSEARDDKRLLAVELTQGRLPVVTPVPLVLPHPMRRLAGTLAELLDEPRYQEAAGCLVEITLTQADAGANPFVLLKRRFPHLLHLRYATEAALADGAPAPQERTGDLLADFRQFAADIGLEPGAIEPRAVLAAGFAGQLARPEAQ